MSIDVAYCCSTHDKTEDLELHFTLKEVNISDGDTLMLRYKAIFILFEFQSLREVKGDTLISEPLLVKFRIDMILSKAIESMARYVGKNVDDLIFLLKATNTKLNNLLDKSWLELGIAEKSTIIVKPK